MPFCTYLQENNELPLNLNICGVQNNCVNRKYVMHMTNISHNNKKEQISSAAQTRNFRIWNPELPGLPDRIGLKATNHHNKSFYHANMHQVLI